MHVILPTRDAYREPGLISFRQFISRKCLVLLLFLLPILFSNKSDAQFQDYKQFLTACNRPNRFDLGQGSPGVQTSQAFSTPELAIDGNGQSAAEINYGPIAINSDQVYNAYFDNPIIADPGAPDTIGVIMTVPAAMRLDIWGHITAEFYDKNGNMFFSQGLDQAQIISLANWFDGSIDKTLFKLPVSGHDLYKVAIHFNSGLLQLDVSQLTRLVGAANSSTSIKLFEIFRIPNTPSLTNVLNTTNLVVKNGEAPVFSVNQHYRTQTGLVFKWYKGFSDQTPLYTGYDFKPAISASTVAQQNFTYYLEIDRNGCPVASQKQPVYLTVNPQAGFTGFVNLSAQTGDSSIRNYVITIVNKGAGSLSENQTIFVNVKSTSPSYTIDRIGDIQHKFFYNQQTNAVSGVNINPGDSIRLLVEGRVANSKAGTALLNVTGKDQNGLPIPFAGVGIGNQNSGGTDTAGSACSPVPTDCSRPSEISADKNNIISGAVSMISDLTKKFFNLFNFIPGVNELSNLLTGMVDGVNTAFLKPLTNFVTAPLVGIVDGDKAMDGDYKTYAYFNMLGYAAGNALFMGVKFDKPLQAGDTAFIVLSDPANFSVSVLRILSVQPFDAKGNPVGNPILFSDLFRDLIPWVSGGVPYTVMPVPITKETYRLVISNMTALNADIGTADAQFKIYEVYRSGRKLDIGRYIGFDSVYTTQQGKAITLNIKSNNRDSCILYHWYTQETFGSDSVAATGPSFTPLIPSDFVGTKTYYVQGFAGGCTNTASDLYPIKVKIDSGAVLEGKVLLMDTAVNVSPGAHLRYVARIFNTGNQTFTDSSRFYLHVLSNLPREFKVDKIYVSGNVGSYDSSTNAVSKVGILPHDSIDIVIDGELLNSYKGGVLNLTVTGNYENGNAIPIQQAPSVRPKYALLLHKTPDRLTAVAGEVLNYRIVVVNTGKVALPIYAKTYIEDVPRTNDYVIRNISVEEGYGTYDTVSKILTNIELTPGDSIHLLVEGNVNQKYITGPIDNDVIGYYEDGIKIPVIPTPTVNKLYNLALRKIANSNGPVAAGDSLGFTIILKNNGPKAISTGDTVWVKDLAPTGYNITGMTPGMGTYNATTSVWTGLNLSVGDSAKLQVQGYIDSAYSNNNLTNKVSGANPDSTLIPVVPDGQVTVPVIPAKYNLALRKIANSSGPVTAGSSVSFTIILKNNGPQTVSTGDTVWVKDLAPTGYNITGMTPGMGTYNATTSVWTGLNLSGGDSVKLQVQGYIDSAYSGNSLTNKVSGANPDSTLIPVTPDSGVVTIPVIPVKQAYNLSLRKVANSSDPVTAGSSVSFTIILKNNGPKTVSTGDTVWVKDLAPTGYNITAMIPGMGTYNAVTSAWTGLNLSGGDSAKLQVQGYIDSAYSGNSLTNKVSGANPDSTLIPVMPDSGVVTIPVIPVKQAYNLSLRKVANSSGPVTAGGSVSFTIILKNNGPKTVSTGDTVWVKDLSPTGYNITAMTPGMGTYNAVTSVWTGLNLSGGDSAKLQVQGYIDSAYSSNSLTNKVSGANPDSTLIPVTPDNGTVTIPVIPVKQAYNLSLRKVANSSGAVTAGSSVSFTIILKNNGPKTVSASDTVWVKDLAPAGYNITAMTPGMGTYNAVTSVWTSLNLSSGDSVKLQVQGYIDSAYSGNSLTNKVSGANPDSTLIPVTDNGGATVKVNPSNNGRFMGYDHLLLNKSADKARVEPGGDLIYHITLTNNGGDTLKVKDTVIVSDVLPNGFDLISNSPSAGTYNLFTGVWTGLSLTKGQTAVIEIKGRIALSFNKVSIKNTAYLKKPDGQNIATASVSVDITDADLFIPNLITPNGDGINDQFRIRGLDRYSNVNLVVVNRWGGTVFQNNNYRNDWNAQGLAEGTYFYVLKAKDSLGKEIVKRGYVMVIR
jgi:uncharacterized repeat protein (TIGR01451 family)/gliding motility-associated-like protein